MPMLFIFMLEDAARHKLLVNFHGAAIPRGLLYWQRITSGGKA